MTLILLYGEDTYRSHLKLKEIVEQYEAKHTSGLNLREFEASEISVDDLRHELSSVSMFKETKLLIIRNPFSSLEFAKELASKKEILSGQDVVVFAEEGKVRATSPLFKFLKDKGKVQEFAPLSGVKLVSWIKQEGKKMEVELPSFAVLRLASQVKGDLWRMSSEVAKLALWNKAGKDKLTDEVLNDLLGRNIETEIFATIEASAKRDRGKALFLLQEHLSSGEQPLYLLSMVMYQFRTMLEVQDLQEQGKGYNGIHPFVVKKTLPLLRQFSAEKLKSAYRRLYEIDTRVKTGEGEVEPLLTHFLSTV